MKPTFVKKWHGISLSSISDRDKSKLPGKEFYHEFYKEFYRRHQTWEDLDPDWVDHKMNTARFLEGRLPDNGKTLSIGCGLGIVEKFLLEAGAKNLEIQEISGEPLNWIRSLLLEKDVHVGFFPDCLTSSDVYDFIFLSGVDACFSPDEWVEFLKEIRMKLSGKGKCLVITPTYQDTGLFSSETSLRIKSIIKTILSCLGIYDRGQLMGWRRTKVEFREAMISAGFKNLTDGVLARDALLPHTYWIEGSIV